MSIVDRRKHEYSTKDLIRDIRPIYVRFGDWLAKPESSFATFAMGAALIYIMPVTIYFMDIIFILYAFMFWWLTKRDRTLPGKLPAYSKFEDTRNNEPGAGTEPRGILFVGNDKNTKEEIWFSNSDARTHILYLGTTGSGKTEGLKSMATNALAWGSGFIYIDGKADTDLWSSLSSLVRRFGRDDDLLVLNYMTGNSDTRAPSNTMNPFSSGSASYLSNMLVSLMPEAEGDNAMWKERAVALINSLMPALTWKRDNQEFPLSVSVVRDYLNLNKIIQLSKDESLPARIREGLSGYLETLPGYVEDAFDENGKEKPVGPDQPMVDTTTVRQQHGYLTMQFTRALQSLGDEYGYIFDAQDADVDMIDTVLNRRILVVLIPALEKSSDETANLGKIIAATLKGMMGQTLGAEVEGESSTVIDNKPTNSSTPFMTIFDEVGYYTAQGMAVMAAQARSLGFCLVFAAQDLQAMEKRVKEEARSITANCNIKIFGKLEDPTQTREFFENQIGKGNVIEVSGFRMTGGLSTGSYHDTLDAKVDKRTRADYDDLKEMHTGEAIISYYLEVMWVNIFYSNPGHAKAMRVTRFIALPAPDEHVVKHSKQITDLRDRLVNKNWTAMNADVALETPPEINALSEGYKRGSIHFDDLVEAGISAIASVHAYQHPQEAAEAKQKLNEPEPPPAAVSTQPQSAPTQDAEQPVGNVDVQERPEQKPLSWSELVEQSETEEEKALYVKKQLDSEVQRILSEAGSNMRQSLFKSKKEDPKSDE